MPILLIICLFFPIFFENCFTFWICNEVGSKWIFLLVAIMSTFLYCSYINVFSSHYNWIFKTNYCVIYIDWIGLDIPRNLVMCWLVDYKELRRRVLHLAEMYTIYQHHIIFISIYMKQRKIPKGFRLKFHCNIANLDYEVTIKKCSLKLIQRTVSNYKRSILTMKREFDKILGK